MDYEPIHLSIQTADDEFYPTVAVQALTRILKDSSLAVHHGMVMQVIMFIFNSLGMRCVSFQDWYHVSYPVLNQFK